MRRIDSSLSFVAVAVLATAFAACTKSADKAAAGAAKTSDTSKAVATNTVDTKTSPVPAPPPKAVASKPAAPSARPVAVSGGKVDPGMSKAQVIALFGKPASDRTRGDFNYLLFANGREKQVGMSDLVVLQGDKVVDAVLRAPNRAYSGTSSSPRAIPAAEAAKTKPPVPPKGGT